MKEVVYNENNIKDEEINRTIKRAKVLIENDNECFLLAKSYNNYQLPGGHVEVGESYAEGLIREVYEETGIKLTDKLPVPFVTMTYFTKDYPTKGVNTKYIGNYYYMKSNEMPNINNIELTNEEEMGNFSLEYIKKELVLKQLEDSLNYCNHKNTVLDTITVIKEHLCNETI